jgi:hypothetical protein
MALMKMMCALALGVACAMAATTQTWGSPDLESQLAGPLPPTETVYWPECGPEVALVDSGLRPALGPWNDCRAS